MSRLYERCFWYILEIGFSLIAISADFFEGPSLAEVLRDREKTER